MTEKVEFLAELPIFADLSDAALDLVAGLAKEYTFEAGAVIAYQRDVANQLFIVREGRLFSRSIDNNGIPRTTHSFFPGNYLQDKWLFIPSAHPATIKGVEPGRLYVIEGGGFVQLLRDHPSIIDEFAPREENQIHYGLSDEAWNEAQKLKLRQKERTGYVGSLLEDETLELFTRRSRWYLLGTLLTPALITLLAAILALTLPLVTPISGILSIIIPLLLVIIGAIFFVLRLIDFREDYFIITNRHLTHHEFDLRRFRIHLIKIPITRIQTVEILKPSLLAQLFNIGSARVTTAAFAGSVLFDNIDNPGEVRDILQRLVSQHKEIESAQTQAAFRQSIESHFGLGPHLALMDTTEPAAIRPPPQKGFFLRLRRRFGWRVVEDGIITYRRSFFILFKQVFFPTLSFVLLGFFLGMGLYFNIPNNILVPAFGILGLGNAFWFIWQLEDWRNDIFQLTDIFVMDVDRVPFGFGESRRQAAITNIQNVDASRPGFFSTLFNYGFVHVQTAGAQTDIVFDHVPNPELIQSDIFERIDESRRRQRTKEEGTRRQEYALLLDVYRQAMEQERIPQRTPPGVPTDLEDS